MSIDGICNAALIMTDKTSTVRIVNQASRRGLLLPLLIAASSLVIATAAAQERLASPPSTRNQASPPSPPGGAEAMRSLYGHAATSAAG